MATKREEVAAEIITATAINDEMIDRLVRSFYARVREDELLGPVFSARIADWKPHLQRMCAFWSSVVLMSGRYHGQPMRTHVPLPVDSVHFDRWLALFCETARKECPPAAAAYFESKARRIADSLELGIARENDVRLAPGQRYLRSTPPASEPCASADLADRSAGAITEGEACT